MTKVSSHTRVISVKFQNHESDILNDTTGPESNEDEKEQPLHEKSLWVEHSKQKYCTAL